MTLLIDKLVMITLDAFLTNDSLVGRLMVITVFCSHGMACVILMFSNWVTSLGVTINELDESTGNNPAQQDTFLIFSMIISDVFLI